MRVTTQRGLGLLVTIRTTQEMRRAGGKRQTERTAFRGRTAVLTSWGLGARRTRGLGGSPRSAAHRHSRETQRLELPIRPLGAGRSAPAGAVAGLDLGEVLSICSSIFALVGVGSWPVFSLVEYRPRKVSFEAAEPRGFISPKRVLRKLRASPGFQAPKYPRRILSSIRFPQSLFRIKVVADPPIAGGLELKLHEVLADNVLVGRAGIEVRP